MKLSSLKGSIKPTPTEDTPPSVSVKLRKDWNDYVSWLETQKMRGNPSLDKGDLGGKMVDAYRKINPSTTVSRETIVPIQNEFSNYRDWSLSEVKAGRAALAEGVTPEMYMKNL
jgi:hypothetical protein